MLMCTGHHPKHVFALKDGQLGQVPQERRAADQDKEWADTAGSRTALLYLNPTELAEVMAAWQQIMMPLAVRRPIGHADQRPADAVPVSFSLIAVPIERTEQGG